MLVAFVLTTKNSKIQYLRIQECCHYTLNGTNNTQMLHCEYEMIYPYNIFDLKRPSWICHIGPYIS